MNIKERQIELWWNRFQGWWFILFCTKKVEYEEIGGKFGGIKNNTEGEDWG